MQPKVFVSHASDDKDRFVMGFSKNLREKGIDAWVDKWEILPGDSLIDKIFEEGLKKADAIIVVLSQFSINKPWVKEELNASIVKKINKGTKIIPVVLDNCEVPESLKSTVWEKITDLENYQENLDRIVAAVYEVRKKPPLGESPIYSRMPIIEIPGLNRIDNIVLKIACESELRQYKYVVDPKTTYYGDIDINIPESELSDSLEILDQHGYIKLHRSLGDGLDSFDITTHGFESYARTYISNYKDILTDTVFCIVNKDKKTNSEISELLGQPLKLIDHILHVLEMNRHLKLGKELGGNVMIFSVSPSLRRMMH